jgi:hypothetical protein
MHAADLWESSGKPVHTFPLFPVETRFSAVVQLGCAYQRFSEFRGVFQYIVSYIGLEDVEGPTFSRQSADRWP